MEGFQQLSGLISICPNEEIRDCSFLPRKCDLQQIKLTSSRVKRTRAWHLAKEMIRGESYGSNADGPMGIGSVKSLNQYTETTLRRIIFFIGENET